MIVNLPDKEMVIEFPDDMDPQEIENELYTNVYNQEPVTQDFAPQEPVTPDFQYPTQQEYNPYVQEPIAPQIDYKKLLEKVKPEKYLSNNKQVSEQADIDNDIYLDSIINDL